MPAKSSVSWKWREHITKTGPRISQRVEEIPKSAIHEMTRLSKQVDDPAFLSWAKPTADTPEHIKEGAIRAIRDGLVGGYSVNAGIPALREQIVRKLERDNNIVADPAEIMTTVGAVEGLTSTVMALIDPGDEVILPSPTYSTHVLQVRLASGVPVFVPAVEDKDFAFDFDAFRAAITPRTKAVMLCTPNNPTGMVFGEPKLRRLAELALEHNLMVITDEAYEYFTYDGEKHFSIASIPEIRKQVVSCFTFTKTYAMTGWRIGYLHADASLIPQIGKAHIASCICPPVVSQYAALAALTGPQACVAEFREHYRSARDLMCNRLDRLQPVFDYQKPTGSYLMFPRILADEGRDSMGFCKKLLREARVSTTPGVAFGPTGESHLRMSFCVPETEIHKAFDRLEAYFDGV